MDSALIVILIVAIAAGAGYLSWWLKKKRRDELATAAKQLGLTYSRVDTIGVIAWPFSLFLKGDGRGAENLLAGTWQGLPVTEFDYWYYDESTDSEGHRSKSYSYFSCVAAQIEADGAHLTLTPENFFTRMADHVMPDIQFETEEFNRAFNVKGEDKKFANDLIDQRMMQWMLQAGKHWSYEVVGDQILVYCKRLKPTELIPLLGTTKGFREHIPRVVYELYGRGGHQ